MKLSILIVNWNTRDLVVKCLNSIARNPPGFLFEVIVVDNASTDGSADTIANLFGHNKRFHLITSLHNLGFAGGCNLAYKRAAGEYILLLNPDTEVREGTLESLVNYLDANDQAGIVGPKLLNPNGAVQSSVRRFPGIWSSMVVLSGLHRFFRPNRYLMTDFDYEHEASVDQLMGAALLTRRKIIEHLGFLDEKFWLWYEEVDFCKRVKEAGYQVKYYPKAVVMHHKGAGFLQMPVYRRKRTAARSLVYYFQKNGRALDVLIIRLALPAVLLAAKTADFLQKLLGIKLRPR